MTVNVLYLHAIFINFSVLTPSVYTAPRNATHALTCSDHQIIFNTPPPPCKSADVLFHSEISIGVG